MPKRTTLADQTPIRVVIVTMDSHLSGAAARARNLLRKDYPGIELTVHSADEWGTDDGALERCHADIANGDIVIATMLFLDDHVRAVMPQLEARRKQCDAMVCCMSAAEVVKLTHVGKFDMSAETLGAINWLKKLRGKRDGKPAGGKGEMAMLRRLPKLLRFIPGTAQDMRAYFLTLQYWLGGSEQNIANMVRLLVDRYADGPRKGLRGIAKVEPPVEYADIGVYHPRMKGMISDCVDKLPNVAEQRGTVGVLLLRSYLLAGNAGHYDGMIAAFQSKGLRVIPAFASGLDQRPAIEKFFMKDGRSIVDAVVSLTGFSLVGGPAYNDSKAAEDMLAKLDVPYLSAHPVEFQTLEQWGASDRGLMPVESTIMVAIPELDGCSGPMVYGGRSDGGAETCAGCDRSCNFTRSETGGDMNVCSERAEMLAARTARLVAMRRSARKDRKVAIVLFNFPPNAGNTGTAAFLSVFESLHRTLGAMQREGYVVEVPATVDELRERIITGNAARFGAAANVHARILAGDHVKNERWLKEIEAQWGPAPGKHQSDGSSIFVLGERFGNIFVGVQPAFGYEGDPMRLLFEKGFAPTHAFSAFYRWLKEDFGASAVLHFGTHGALEFMPGKQTGLSQQCWPDRMIGDLPNLYLYASNNPSEGAIAKRRSAATLISYLTPPVAHAGLYRGLVELKASIERWRGLPPEDMAERAELAVLVQAQASALDLVKPEPAWSEDEAGATILKLADAVLEMEYTLIPHGLHVVGEDPSIEQRAEMLQAVADASHGIRPELSVLEAIVRGDKSDKLIASLGAADHAANVAIFDELAATDKLLAVDHEIPALIKALDGKFIRPAPGGDLLRTPAILPTGRNLHGFDPFRIPSAFAVQDGAQQAQRLIDKHVGDGNKLPESIAIVLWGTDNLKNEGAPIAQALALLGARPRFDGYGRLTGAELIPLEQLKRPRIDVIITMSGIFRDLLPLQIRLLAEACFLAASADEPVEMNFIRKHALAYQAEHKCDMETASLRVFGNADGAYGSNVNHLVENSRWEDEDELAETYTRRKSFAYGLKGQPVQQTELLKSALADVDLAYQNLDSVELGVTTVDHYFDTLGGISRAVRRAKGGTTAPVYIGDQTRGAGTVRTLSEQVALETRTRMLNPKWYEGMLKHGYEGVRQIEEHVTNTMGWSATTGEVAPWVYRQLTETFVLDPEMRARLAALNPVASAKVANRLIEAHERNYWSPDPEMLEVLRKAGEELEDRLEGVGVAA
ncbi:MULTISPECIES: magnesium chelatase subunit H [Rhodopseudomonas]|uniref:magnesium chelatase n=1 Tax=Rhodopseudomonas palustris TaxID=1076 RepID=A0A0D7F1U1_RHOPL|nr:MULTISPECIES: magnesium chelatase subunit H [Rhodopseudomonas]KIZ47039.1 magnesium chelatase [Rhodopseudomonas palustris]MDF3813367.1 magnesium chelatase subunit H [Rhodopseudomonas sp. BAL398]WOK20379.1 magnesium chelatase subunit H [Rhodopseudomonas sp. BAL398]